MSPRVYLAAVVAALAVSCAHQPMLPIEQLKPETPPEEVLIPWTGDLRSPQTAEEVADMLRQQWESDPHHTAASMIDPDEDESVTAHPLQSLIAAWVTQFCILNQWPLPECGPPLHRRIYSLIVNRA